MKRMNHYNEYDERNELSIIIREQDKQRNNGNDGIQLDMEHYTVSSQDSTVNDQEMDDEIVIKNLNLLKSTETFRSNNNNTEDETLSTVNTNDGDDEYDTLDELFDIAKLLSDSLDNRQLTSTEKEQLMLDSTDGQQCVEDVNSQRVEDLQTSTISDTNRRDDDNNDNQELYPTEDNLISSRNVEIKQVVIGYPDRMSIVIEESDIDNDEDYASETSVSQTTVINSNNWGNTEKILSGMRTPDQQQNTTYEEDSSSGDMMKFINNLNEPTRPRSQSPSSSDVTTIDENDVACEIEIPHQPLEDHWVEDCYATVVRHTPTSTNASTSTEHPTTIFIHNNNNNKNNSNNSSNNNNSNSNNITHCTIKKEADTSIQDDLDIYSPRKEYAKKSVDSRIPSRESIEQPRCHTCREIVYPLEALQTIGRVYHKSCFKCHQCQRVLTLGKYSVWEGNPYCEPHYLVLFKSFGHYDGNAPKTSSTTYDTPSHNRRSDSPIPVEERPSGHVTQALVAKFQGLETGNKMNGGGSTQSYSTQNQLSRIVLNPSQPAATNAQGDVFPSSGRARQLVERWNKMPNEKKIVGGRTSPVLNGKSHVTNAAYKLPNVEPKPLVRRTLEQPRPLVSELKQNFNHKPEDEAYSSAAESTESAKLSNVCRTKDSKQNEFPTPA
uniref:LIM zinc-binding domain-containing protein n=1 Tax=Trichobilharzia regenti TaxID=157069 RepID=A0AA85IV85_TRIRE|nr:unnamed protein product [Trichobilharzia regenti]